MKVRETEFTKQGSFGKIKFSKSKIKITEKVEHNICKFC